MIQNPKGRFRDYVDRTGRLFFVCDGISGGKTWATYYFKPTGSLKRLVSPALPVCLNAHDAQARLDKWARRRGLGAIEERNLRKPKA